MRVLITEDDQFYAQYVSEFLRDHGVETTVVHEAEGALAVDAKTYDGAVIDVMLPNDPGVTGISAEESRGGFGTGIAVARRLLTKNPKIRIIFLSSGVGGQDAQTWAEERGFPFIWKSESSYLIRQALRGLGLLGPKQPPLSFIVHGHDSTSLLELKNYIQNTLKWREPIVLREQPNWGKTVIEKLEVFSDRADCVFVLLTPDDVVVGSGGDEAKRRSRQNVIFELGVFYGALGRKSGRIVVLYRGPVELPSDIAGVVWIDISNGIESAGEQIRREIDGIC
jgi:CheY-like chemotaxis protein